ncbi:sigma 54-interacting transcriptional regulator [soil metagenome]
MRIVARYHRAVPDDTLLAPVSVLVVDDDRAMCEMLVGALAARGFEVQARSSAAEALEASRARDFDVVVTDINMREVSGVELCRRLLEGRPLLPVIVMTAYGTLETAIEAIRAGAYDFLPKPFRTEQLAMAIQRGATLARLERKVQRLERAIAPAAFGDLVGNSTAMRELYALLGKLAQSEAPVLIHGETGTGKELIVRAIHKGGPRAAGPLVAINCAAMPPALLESELFGHAKGAFTDARTAKTGLFVAAHGGTLFLDEIGELPMELQPKLLRAIQERVVRPIGATEEVPFDARLVAATNRDLETMVEEHRFRQDLLFRINVLQVAVPPLRARGGDILVLACHFLELAATRAKKRVTGFSPEASQRLMAYVWPGNVRELENCVEAAVALASHDQIAVTDLSERIRAFEPTQIVLAGDDPTTLVTLDELERRYFKRVLETVGGNKSAAAHVLWVERRTLYRMLERAEAEPGQEI